MENFTLSPLVPQELMEEILLRLPVKSLLRFKCVCNSWLSLISNPQFAQLHFDLDAAPTHRVLVNLTNDHIESVDIDDDSAGVFLRFPHPPSPLLVLQFFGSCSCRGFLLVNNIAYGVLNLIVWNPSTGVHKRIPDPDFDFRTREYLCGFGYDASKDDYLVTFIIFDEDEDAFPPKHQRAMIKLFSLKTNSWDCIYIDIRCFCLRLLQTYYNNIAGSFLFGALHWLVFSKDKFVILAFNLVERRLFEIPLPHDLIRSLRYYPHGLRVIGGCLGVWCSNYAMGRRGEMWIMKEYQVLASWSRSFCFSDDEPYVKFSPICLTRDNALLGSGISSLRKLCGETGQWLSDHFTYDERGKFNIYNRHCALYRESLLSLPTDSGERTQDEQESRYPIDPWEWIS